MNTEAAKQATAAFYVATAFIGATAAQLLHKLRFLSLTHAICYV